MSAITYLTERLRKGKVPNATSEIAADTIENLMETLTNVRAERDALIDTSEARRSALLETLKACITLRAERDGLQAETVRLRNAYVTELEINIEHITELSKRIGTAHLSISESTKQVDVLQELLDQERAKLAAIDTLLIAHYDPRYSDAATTAIYHILHPEGDTYE